VTLTPLPWDTEFFGVPIASADLTATPLEEAVHIARTSGLACVYLFAPADRRESVQAAVRAGGRLVALREELSNDRPLTLGPPTQNAVRLASRADRAEVRALAERLASYSRFASDPRFGPDRASAMYRIWADRCLDDGVVALERGGGGLVGVTSHDGRADVALVYVAPEVAQRGVGQDLIRRALEVTDATQATVTTDASNVRALRLYQGLGFRTVAVTAIVHLWTDEVVDD
jgi:ribosomal protein S18 acetylase RimI-like enzyme